MNTKKSCFGEKKLSYYLKITTSLGELHLISNSDENFDEMVDA